LVEFKGTKAGRFTDHAADWIPAGYQSEDR